MVDKRLFYFVSLLLSFSVVMSYSLSVFTTEFYDYSQFHFFIRQCIAVSLGIFVMWLLAQIPADRLMTKMGFGLIIIFSFLIVFMQFLPESLASSAGGAKRWIRLPGFSLAPSEFFKIGFVFFLAWSFSRRFVGKVQDSIGREFMTFMPYLVLFSLIVFLIAVWQNDLGQVILMSIILIIMLLFAGGSAKLVGILFLIISSLASVAILTSTHRISRLKMWWASAQDTILSFLPQNLATHFRIDSTAEPYQIFYSTTAINNGGIFGQGLGNGVVKLGFLSEVHTDIVLSGLSEELGIIGVVIFVMIFALILHRILKIANRVRNDVYSLFCIGIATMLGFSFIINAFGITGLIPIKGIAVPFLSYGGSAILASCVAIGMVLSISKTVPKGEL